MGMVRGCRRRRFGARSTTKESNLEIVIKGTAATWSNRLSRRWRAQKIISSPEFECEAKFFTSSLTKNLDGPSTPEPFCRPYGHCPGFRLSLPADPAFQKVTKAADLVAVGDPTPAVTPSSTLSPTSPRTSGAKRTAPQSAPKDDDSVVKRAKCLEAAENRIPKNKAAGDPSTTKPLQINLIDDDDDDDGPDGPTRAPIAGSTKEDPLVIDDSDDESIVYDLTDGD